MQPFKALLVALVLGGSAAASAAGNNSQSLTVEPTLEPAPVHAQAWPAIRAVEHAWPQWMHNLTGTVLVLQDARHALSGCHAPQCTQVSGLPQPMSATTSTYQQAAQQPSAAPQARHASLPWQAQPDARMPQRLSF